MNDKTNAKAQEFEEVATLCKELGIKVEANEHFSSTFYYYATPFLEALKELINDGSLSIVKQFTWYQSEDRPWTILLVKTEDDVYVMLDLYYQGTQNLFESKSDRYVDHKTTLSCACCGPIRNLRQEIECYCAEHGIKEIRTRKSLGDLFTENWGNFRVDPKRYKVSKGVSG